MHLPLFPNSPPRRKEAKPEPLGWPVHGYGYTWTWARTCEDVHAGVLLGGSVATGKHAFSTSLLLSPTHGDGRRRQGPAPAYQGSRLRTVVLARGWGPKQMGPLISTRQGPPSLAAGLLEFSSSPPAPRRRGKDTTLASECSPKPFRFSAP